MFVIKTGISSHRVPYRTSVPSQMFVIKTGINPHRVPCGTSGPFPRLLCCTKPQSLLGAGPPNVCLQGRSHHRRTCSNPPPKFKKKNSFDIGIIESSKIRNETLHPLKKTNFTCEKKYKYKIKN